MAYGMLVNTTAGQINTLQMRTFRLFTTLDVSGTSGTATITGFDITRGHIIGTPFGGILDPVYIFDNSTKFFSWARGPSTGTSFRFYFYLYR